MSHSRMAGQRDSASEQGDIEPLLSGYRPPPGTFDEMVDREGRVRAHWQPLLAMLARLGPNELSPRFAAADRHLRDRRPRNRAGADPRRRSAGWTRLDLVAPAWLAAAAAGPARDPPRPPSGRRGP